MPCSKYREVTQEATGSNLSDFILHFRINSCWNIIKSHTSGHGDGEREFYDLEEGDVQCLRDGILAPVAVPHAVVGTLFHGLRHDEEADERRRLEREARLARHLSGQCDDFIDESSAQRRSRC